MHILGLETVCIALLYVFSMVIFKLKCFFLASYVQLGANIEKFMLYSTSMLLPMKRVAFDSAQQSLPKFMSKRLTRPCNKG